MCPGPQAEASHAHLAWQSTGLAQHMSSALGRAGSRARAMPAPQVPIGQESMRFRHAKPSTLAVRVPRLDRTGLEKDELSRQDMTLCPQQTFSFWISKHLHP